MDAQHFPFYIILSNYVWFILFYQNKDHNVRQIRFHVCIKMHRCKRRVCKRKTLLGQSNTIPPRTSHQINSIRLETFEKMIWFEPNLYWSLFPIISTPLGHGAHTISTCTDLRISWGACKLDKRELYSPLRHAGLFSGVFKTLDRLHCSVKETCRVLINDSSS